MSRNERLIRDDLNASSRIAVRTGKRKRIFGIGCRAIARSFDELRYHQRHKVETVFSALKKKFRESLKARKFQEQIQERKIKLILYKTRKIFSRSLSLSISEEFYRAKKSLFK